MYKTNEKSSMILRQSDFKVSYEKNYKTKNYAIFVIIKCLFTLTNKNVYKITVRRRKTKNGILFKVNMIQNQKKNLRSVSNTYII